MHGLGDVFGADGGRFAEIGDGAGDFEDSIVGAGGKAHAADGHFESAFAGIVEGADSADGAGGLDGGANLRGRTRRRCCRVVP